MLRFTGIRLRSAVLLILYGRSCRPGSQAWCEIICFHRRHADLYSLRISQHGNIEGCIGTPHTGYWHWMSENRLKLNPDNTELLLTGTRHSVSRLADGGSRLVLGAEIIDSSSSAFLLGVKFTSNLCLDKHESIVSGMCFFQLSQLRLVRRSLDSEAASTLIQSFVSSRVDYCNCLMVGAPKKCTETLQRVMNAAACVPTQTKKYDRWLTRILHDEQR